MLHTHTQTLLHHWMVKPVRLHNFKESLKDAFVSFLSVVQVEKEVRDGSASSHDSDCEIINDFEVSCSLHCRYKPCIVYTVCTSACLDPMIPSVCCRVQSPCVMLILKFSLKSVDLILSSTQCNSTCPHRGAYCQPPCSTCFKPVWFVSS